MFGVITPKSEFKVVSTLLAAAAIAARVKRPEHSDSSCSEWWDLEHHRGHELDGGVDVNRGHDDGGVVWEAERLVH